MERTDEAKVVFDQAKSKGVTGEGFVQIERFNASAVKIKKVKIRQKGNTTLVNLHIQGQHKEAILEASKLLLEFPSSITLLNIIGIANTRLGKLEEAVKAFSKAIAIKPDIAEFHYNIGKALHDKGNLEAAIEAYNAALSLKPDFAEAYFNIGMVFHDQGKLGEEIEAYNKFLLIKPDNAEAYNNIGTALKDQGKLDEAKEAYKKAIALKPDYKSAKHMLSSLSGDTTEIAPREYVESLFDIHATKFEALLVDELNYKTPKLISDILVNLNRNSSLGSILDLGCGTGLLGLEIKEHCSKLEGIDLSKKMLGIARQKKVMIG